MLGNSIYIKRVGTEIYFGSKELQTIENTTTETSQFNLTNAIGTTLVRANTLKVGDIYRIETKVLLSTGVSQVATQRVKFGGVLLLENSGTLPNSLTDNYAEIQLDLRVLTLGSTGTITVQGRSLIQSTTGISTVVMRSMFSPSPVTINTTIDNTIDLTYQWAEALAANILKINTSIINLYTY